MEHNNVFIAIKVAVASLFGAFGAAFGWLGWLVVGWVACMVIDYVSGTCAALRNGEWSSANAREGIWHKAGMIMVVIAASLLDGVLGVSVNNLNIPFEYTTLLVPVVLVWYSVTEIGSVLENASRLGVNIPPVIAKMLAGVENTIGGDDE